MLVVIITSRDFTLEDPRGVTGHVIEDDVSGGGAVQHLQAGHHEDRGAGILGGNVTVELNLQKNSKLEKSDDCSVQCCVLSLLGRGTT